MFGLPTGTVTFLFTDIEGSTRLLQELRDRYVDLLSEHRTLVRSVIAEAGGQEVDSQGDAFFAVFQRASDSVRAAVALELAMSRHSWPERASVRVRIGVHSGDAVLTPGGYVGLEVHRAARICKAGHGGQILLSQTTRLIVEEDLPSDVGLLDLGEHRLKDLQRPTQIFQILHPDLPADFPPLASLHAFTHNLPVQLTSFIGREWQMAEVKRLLGTTRLLTLTGFGGCGKTRLALQVAADLLEEYPEGVWWVELADLADPALVTEAIASALHVREEPGRPLLTTLSDYLREKRLLMVLDNCEHVVTACAPLARTLLRTCPRVQILATSREIFAIGGEFIWRVPPLSLPDPKHPPRNETVTQSEAVRLFVERAVAARPGFAVTAQNAPAIVRVCQQLDGIPLAIELAAAQVRALSVPEIAAHVTGDRHLLPGGRRTVDRHQTLHAVMEWSYRLLSQPERILLRRLSVFAGSFTLESAEAICTDEGVADGDVLDLLTGLIDKSLVIVDQQSGETRYRFLDTVRHYAREKLEESYESEKIHNRHRDWYIALAERAEPLLQISEQWLDRLETEHSNLSGALDWCQQSTDWVSALRLASALQRFWFVRGFWTEGRRWLEEGLANSKDAPLALRARALGAAGRLSQYQADYNRTLVLCEESLAISRTLDDKTGMANALTTLGNVLFERGDYSAARNVHEESLAYGREVGDRWTIGVSLLNLAAVVMHEGDYERARALCEESLSVFREVGDKRGRALALNVMGMIVHDQGDFGVARSLFEQALALQQEFGDRRAIGISLTDLGLVAWELGDYVTAVRLYEDALAIRRELGDRRGVATLLYNLGRVALRQGDDAQATSLFVESLVIRRATGNKPGVARSLEGLARSLRSRPDRAACLFGATATIREAVGEILPQPDQIENEQDLNVLRAEMGEHAFSAAWLEGRAMTLDQAIEYALAFNSPQPYPMPST